MDFNPVITKISTELEELNAPSSECKDCLDSNLRTIQGLSSRKWKGELRTKYTMRFGQFFEEK